MISHNKGKSSFAILMLLSGLVVGVLLTKSLTDNKAVQANDYIDNLNDLRISTRLLVSASNSLDDDFMRTAFKNLEEFKKDYVNKYSQVVDVNSKIKDNTNLFNTLDNANSFLVSGVDGIIGKNKDLQTFFDLKLSLSESLPTAQNDFEELISIMQAEDADVSQLLYAKDQVLFLEKIMRILDNLFIRNTGLQQSLSFKLDMLSRYSQHIKIALSVLEHGDSNIEPLVGAESKAVLQSINESYGVFVEFIDEILRISPELLMLQDMVSGINQNGQLIIDGTVQMMHVDTIKQKK